MEADGPTAYTALLREGPGRCVATVIGGRIRHRPGDDLDAEARRLA
ncbi:hypothetical protein [Streptosporangium sp. NPDC003464]